MSDAVVAPATPAHGPCDLLIRPLARGETEVVAAVFDGLTGQQRYHRFHTGMPRLTASTLRYLSTPEEPRHVVLVAEHHGRPIGLARYVVGARGEEAEVALEVVAAHAGRGVGSELLQHLRRHAVANGIGCVEVVIAGDNHPALRLARRFGVRLQRSGRTYSGRLLLASEGGAAVVGPGWGLGTSGGAVA